MGHNNHKKEPPAVKDFPAELLQRLTAQRDGAFKKFPLLFTLLGTFGLVATYAGFSNLINKVPLLARDPVVTLLVGLAVLVVTGKLYKKLG
jgi:hypothetical protein